MKSVKKHLTKIVVLIALWCFLTIPFLVTAQGNLMIFPKRIIFDGGQRFQSLSLSNNGNDTARYVISMVQIRMKEDGSFETITEPDSAQNFADRNIRFFPRTVTLGPNEAQLVKIQLIRSKELAPGEYRSHIYLRAEKEKEPLGTKDAAKATNIAINIKPIFGFSIPLIIKIGESTTKITMANPVVQMSENGPSLKFKMNRTGNMSVYGDITVNHIALSGKITKVGKIQGLAIYAPTPVRYFQIPLDKTIQYNSGKLQVIYAAQPPASSILAETDLLLQ